MNKLITTGTGGFPLVLEDVRFLDDAYRSAFSYVFKSFMRNEDTNNIALILYGCEKSTSGTFPDMTNTYSPGVVVLAGEPLYFEGLTTVFDIQRKFVLHTEFSSEGSKIFKNGNTVDTYQLRTAKLLPVITDDPFKYADAKRLNNQILSFVIEKNTTFSILPDSLMQGSFPEGQVRFMRDALGFVHFRGIWHSTFLENDQLLGTLPAGFRPQVEMNYRLDAASTTISGNCLIRIQTNGQIRAVGMPTEEIRFNQIPPFLAV
jgi:hypothetical protein